jgi:hypothetical protein
MRVKVSVRARLRVRVRVRAHHLSSRALLYGALSWPWSCVDLFVVLNVSLGLKSIFQDTDNDQKEKRKKKRK